MSVRPAPVRVTITWQGVKGKENIDKAMRDAVLKAVNQAIKEVIQKAMDIVPESAEAPGRYGLSYRSEELMNSYIMHLLKERNKIRNVPLGGLFIIQEYWSASYAKYVNALPTVGTNWSKPGSEGNFIQTLHAMLAMKINQNVATELNKVQIASGALFAGVATHGNYNPAALSPAAFSSGEVP